MLFAVAASHVFANIPKLVSVVRELSANIGGVQALSVTQAVQLAPLPSTVVRKHSDGPGSDGEPTIVQRILAGEVDLIVNTPFGVGPRVDGYEIRTAAVTCGVPCVTTVQGLAACVQGIEALVRGDVGVAPLQEHHARIRRGRAAASTGPGGMP